MTSTDDESIFARIWREHRLSCLSRTTLGSYLLGTLSPEERDYVDFHIGVLNCPYCQSNLDDLRVGSEMVAADPGRTERLFESSVGFVRREAPRR